MSYGYASYLLFATHHFGCCNRRLRNPNHWLYTKCFGDNAGRNEGTDAFGNDPLSVHYHKSHTILSLQRKRDYSLRFKYTGQETDAFLSSSLEPAWVFADLFTDLIGYVVDGITGDWNSFDDPIFIRFPAATSIHADFTEPRIELGEDNWVPKTGIIVNAKLGFVFPMSEFLGLSYGFGLGYDAIPRFTFLLTYEGGSGVNILPQYSSYTTNGSYSHYNLECRFKMQGNFYITGGGGWSNITTDSLELYRYGYNDTTGIYYSNTLRTPPATKWMPTLFAGIGIAGQTSYIELRHTFGLSNIFLSNGEIGKFQTTSLTFGVNLHF